MRAMPTRCAIFKNVRLAAVVWIINFYQLYLNCSPVKILYLPNKRISGLIEFD
jgi:hypothetical protein